MPLKPASLEVPAVTQDDLHEFHSRIFGCYLTFGASSATAGPQNIDDDGLGFYPDGTKRTLTDEQVAIFRHSEIHSLGLKSSRRAEASEERAPTKHQVRDVVDSASQGTLETALAGEEDDEEEYARFLEQERKQFEAAAAAKARRTERQSHTHDRNISTRRKVRELDRVAEADAVLDYD